MVWVTGLVSRARRQAGGWVGSKGGQRVIRRGPKAGTRDRRVDGAAAREREHGPHKSSGFAPSDTGCANGTCRGQPNGAGKHEWKVPADCTIVPHEMCEHKPMKLRRRSMESLSGPSGRSLGRPRNTRQQGSVNELVHWLQLAFANPHNSVLFATSSCTGNDANCSFRMQGLKSKPLCNGSIGLMVKGTVFRERCKIEDASRRILVLSMLHFVVGHCRIGYLIQPTAFTCQ